MTKHWTVLVTASLATLLALFAPAPVARADIFQWQYINPANPSQGKQPSTTALPRRRGRECRARRGSVEPQPDDGLPDRRGSQRRHRELTDLTDAELSQANLTNANFSGYSDESRLITPT